MYYLENPDFDSPRKANSLTISRKFGSTTEPSSYGTVSRYYLNKLRINSPPSSYTGVFLNL